MKQTLFAVIVVPAGLRRRARFLASAALLVGSACGVVPNATAQESVAERISRLDKAMTRVQAQMEESQKEMKEIQGELTLLRSQAGPAGEEPPAETASANAARLASAVEDLREKQSMQEAQVAVQEQTKVESDSKFPVKISGQILISGFVNTRAVDAPSAPTMALPGSGTTGATFRQSVFGLDASGPHLFGATSHADVRFDLDGTQQGGGYANSLGFLRLRTAHAALEWGHTRAFFSLDRPLISPYTPMSLTAIAEPALSWSGNLWAWNPQIGIAGDVPLRNTSVFRLEAALTDIADPPGTYVNPSPPPATPSTSEQSRWPGLQLRSSWNTGRGASPAGIGIGGLFAPHRTADGYKFNSWAGTLDFRLPLFAHFELEGSAYRGQALGGLGGGAYKDFVYRIYAGDVYYRALEDVGGWIQVKQLVNQRLEFNEAMGIDNVPAHQLLPFAVAGPTNYYNLARNRTITGNLIYRPSAYLLYSIEYRRIASSPANSPTVSTDILGIAAGYRF